MNKDTFLADFQDLLQSEEDIAETTDLHQLEEWDSLSIMSAIAYFDKKFGIRLTINDFNAVNTVQDLIVLSQGQIQ